MLDVPVGFVAVAGEVLGFGLKAFKRWLAGSTDGRSILLQRDMMSVGC
jgi:hypothetical protein